MRKSTTLGITFSLCAAVLIGLLFIDDQAIANKPLPADLYGKLTPIQLPDIELQTHNQNHINWLSLTEKPLFLTVGFTQCHKQCPVTMMFYQQLAEAVGNSATLSFLTIDPKEDSPEALSKFLEKFGSHYTGIRIDNQDHLQQVLHALKQNFTLTKNNHFMEHQTHIYLLHPKVEGILVYPERHPDLMKIRRDLLILNK